MSPELARRVVKYLKSAGIDKARAEAQAFDQYAGCLVSQVRISDDAGATIASMADLNKPAAVAKFEEWAASLPSE